MKDFSNKIVVITGAASGMGRAYALAFARQGSLLALCDLDEQGLAETARQVSQLSSKEVLTRVFDVSDRNAIYQFSEEVKQLLGNAHVVINNAGIEGASLPTWEMDDANYDRLMQVNFFSVVHGTRAFLPQLIEENRGVIVNVSSVFGLIGTPNQSDYCASKFAVRGFTESLMVELINSPIQVHLLHPGGIATNIVKQAHHQAFAKEFLTTSPDQIADYLIKAIQKNQTRIVYGNQSFNIWLAEKFLPLRVRCKLLWRQMLKTLDLSAYSILNK